MKKEERQTYKELYDNLQIAGIQGMEDYAILKRILLIRIASIQKNMTYLSKYSTAYNQARLFELTQMYQLVERAMKSAKASRTS